MLKKSVQSIINKFGFTVTRIKNQNDTFGISKDHILESEQLIKIVRNKTMVADIGLASLYQQTLFLEENNIDGDYVECGVWKGGAVGLMALVNLRHGRQRRHIHLFDSFEEICEPDEAIDGDRAIREVKQWTETGAAEGRLVPLKGIYDNRGGPGSIEENEELLVQTIGYDAEHIHFHKGWFQHTLPNQHSDIDKIAILRIDADWYASTKICLDYLFDKVVSGGFVIIDDYGAYDGCKKAVDEFLGTTGKSFFLNYVNNDIRYLIIP